MLMGCPDFAGVRAVRKDINLHCISVHTSSMQKSISDLDYLKDVYASARNRYRPNEIRVLIIAEAPPCALDRFFYFEDVKKQDSLFLEIMGILYPEKKQR